MQLRHTKVPPPWSFSRQAVAFCASLPSDMPADWYRFIRWLPLGLIGIALISVPVQVFSRSGLPQLRHLQEERIRLLEQEQQLRHEIAQLRAEVDRIKSDPSAVEQVARDELGLVRPTEVVFQFGR